MKNGQIKGMISRRILIFYYTIQQGKSNVCTIKGKRKVQGVPQSQTAAFPRPQEEKEPTNPNKHRPNKRTKSTD